VVRRFELEWMRRGGPKCIGPLIITFLDLKHSRVRYDAMAPAVRVLTALGLYKVAVRGRAGNSEFRCASEYVPTYLPTLDCPEPTDEWRQITTIDDAKMIAQGARRKGSNSAPKKTESQSSKRECLHSRNGIDAQSRNGSASIPKREWNLNPETGSLY
jgi:hypothetical protein